MSRVISSLSTLLFSLCVWLTPAIVFAAAEKTKEPEWVLSYFLVLLFLFLSIFILCRPTKRADTALTQEEQDTEKAEKQKKSGH